MTEAVLQETLKQGGMFTIVMVLAFFYRRDFLMRETKKDEVIALLCETVKDNTAAMQSLEVTNARLVEVIQGLRGHRVVERKER